VSGLSQQEVNRGLRVHERGSKSVRHTIRVVGTVGLWHINWGKDTLFEALGLRSRGQP
jgi:hypothetical protein